jgi:hypothetical protein
MNVSDDEVTAAIAAADAEAVRLATIANEGSNYHTFSFILLPIYIYTKRVVI